MEKIKEVCFCSSDEYKCPMHPERATCSICGQFFSRSTEPDRRYISCHAHSFGEVEEEPLN